MENINLAELIKEYDEQFGHILGYRRMTKWINHFNHTNYSKNRVHRIMKKLGIHSVIRKKKRKYRSSTPETIAENKLQRDFYASAPNEKWASDVTEFKIPKVNKKVFLSAIEVRKEALTSITPTQYPIAESKRIKKYKEKWCA